MDSPPGPPGQTRRPCISWLLLAPESAQQSNINHLPPRHARASIRAEDGHRLIRLRRPAQKISAHLRLNAKTQSIPHHPSQFSLSHRGLLPTETVATTPIYQAAA